MKFEQFVEEVKKEVKSFLGEDYNVSVNCVLKINRELQGISIRHQSSAVAPSVYLEDFYVEYQNGKEIKQIAKEIIDMSSCRKPNVNVVMENIQDYEWTKSRLRVKLINHEKNVKLLQSVPYETLLDLAIVPYILLANGEEIMSTTVNNQLLDRWGVTKNEMLEQAKENTLTMESVIIEKMTDFILRMMLKEIKSKDEVDREDEQEALIRAIVGKDTGSYDMYILTNQVNRNGAFAAFQVNNLSDLADQIGVDKLYLLPSSIHEAIAIPIYDMEQGKLREMVMSVNSTEVTEEEILSDSLYVYTKQSNNLAIAK
jgi:hypothetical protein